MDLKNNSIVLAETIQSILRRECVNNSYEIIKDITRNNNEFSIDNVVDVIEKKLSNNINKDSIINEIKMLNVIDYTGVA